MNLKLTISFIFIILLACSSSTDKNVKKQESLNQIVELKFDTAIKTAHILVALCDNKYQGIIPVPKAIGNGEDFDNNLYWGCSYGIRSFFKASKNWTLIAKKKVSSIRLERLVFKHKTSNFYLVCDAYKGQNIKDCTIDFLNSSAGLLKDTLTVNGKTLGINGNSKLVAYIGHDGLMDFRLNQNFVNVDRRKRDVVILACKSKKYFSSYIQQAKANPLLWTSDLMCPEAYTIHDLLEVYTKSPTDVEKMNNVAAQAYSKYQKCGLRASKNLLVSGF
ncbi:MAG: hypothetical protein QM541_10480 [Flavobacterium sp.]|nr:hypothetical protein [Flavobacterium sp.]